MKALLDINVLMDFLAIRESYEDAASIMDFARRRCFTACVSAHEVTTLSYFLERDPRFRGHFRDKIGFLLGMLRVLPVDHAALETALVSDMNDFEDAVLDAVSLREGLEYIVTRNMADFARSRVRAITPSDFLKVLRQDHSSFLLREPAPSYRTRPRRRAARSTVA